MDPLSDLLIAEEFDELLAREELRRSRTGETLAVALLDVDGLREVGASYGRDSATEVLRLCASVLRATTRTVDAVAHTGDDEFSVLLHATDVRSGVAWADRFEDELEQAGAEHPAAPLTCALGLADTIEEASLMLAATRARRRMEVIQTVRKLRRARERGS
jgi:diguanylate cyclase